LTNPRGVAVNSKGHTVVADSFGASVSVLTPDGEKIHLFGSRASAVAMDNSRMLMV